MANEYYNMTGNPQNSGPGRSVDMRAEFIAIAAAFDKLLALSSVGSQLIGVNAAGSAMEAKGPIGFGDWTPAFSFDTPGDLSITYTLQTGRYVRLGPLVIAFFHLNMSVFTHTTAAGGAKITGLTYPSVITSGYGIVHFTNVTFADLHITPYVQAGSIIQFVGASSGSVDTTIGVAHFLTGSNKKLEGLVAYMA